MKQRESKLSSKIMAELRRRGMFCFKVHGNALMMSGLPDVVACVRGLFVGFEVKMPENRDGSTKIQIHRAQEIREAGGVSYVVCSVREVNSIVDGLLAQLEGSHER